LLGFLLPDRAKFRGLENQAALRAQH
jgi:hypothetical protein